MHKTGTDATTSIITGGMLVGSPATIGIVSSFVSLYYTTQPAPPAIRTTGRSGGTGGLYPNLRTDDSDNQPIIPPKEIEDTLNVITLKINFKDNVIEKTYYVPKKHHDKTVRIFDLLNSTQKKFQVTIGHIKRLAINAKVRIFSIKAKKHK